jgi:hypothetical protein
MLTIIVPCGGDNAATSRRIQSRTMDGANTFAFTGTRHPAAKIPPSFAHPPA